MIAKCVDIQDTASTHKDTAIERESDARITAVPWLVHHRVRECVCACMVRGIGRRNNTGNNRWSVETCD